MIYTVIDRRTKKCIGSYQAEHETIKAPFIDVVNQVHYIVEDGKLPEGYYLDDDFNLHYDFSYVAPVSTPQGLTEAKLIGILDYYTQESARFASENSVAMMMLGYTTEQKIAFVSKAVADFEEIKKHVEMFSYYVIWGMFDEIVRDEILTEERITAMKASLYAKVFA